MLSFLLLLLVLSPSVASIARQITTCETALDLATLTMCSTPITAESIAAAGALTVTDVTTLPETTTNRKGGHPRPSHHTTRSPTSSSCSSIWAARSRAT